MGQAHIYNVGSGPAARIELENPCLGVSSFSLHKKQRKEKENMKTNECWSLQSPVIYESQPLAPQLSRVGA
jgi:hypothetical protein